MNTFLFFLAGLVTSLIGVSYLLFINEKRRRVFRSPPQKNLPQMPFVGWTLVFLPSFVLIVLDQMSAFLSWFGAVTVCAWLIACIKPRPNTEPPAKEPER